MTKIDKQPTMEINLFGDKSWFLDGMLHREDGPAVEFRIGYRAWYRYGNRHREDGLAIECSSGRKEWWYNGEWIDCKTQEEFERLVRLKAFW